MCKSYNWRTAVLNDKRSTYWMLLKTELKIHIDSSCSNYSNFSMDVPQGTVLGTLLFLIYINDVIHSMDTRKIFCYIDNAIISWKNWIDVYTIAENIISKLKKNWLHENQFPLNISTT